MNIHNSMEDAVTQEVDILYEHLKSENITWLNCDCETCRLETACYVLNRIQPKYSVSERGILHNALDMEDGQLKTDITSLALEGIRLISSSPRKYHSSKKENIQVTDENKMFYNFPIIMGTIYNGGNFEPLENVQVKLKINNEDAVMFDSTWANPAHTFKSTNGSYNFWPAAIECDKNSETKVFNLSYEISAEGYHSTVYAMELPLIPEKNKKTTMESTFSIKVKDIFLFNTNTENPME